MFTGLFLNGPSQTPNEVSLTCKAGYNQMNLSDCEYDAIVLWYGDL
jgi:hypothetical protein